MSVPIRRRIAAAAGIAVATGVLTLAGAATASANELSQWYPTAVDCQTAGNVYAQQGLITGFRCDSADSGYVLTGWDDRP